MVKIIYSIIKIVLAIFLFIPLFIALGILGSNDINTKGQFNQIVSDIKSLLNWLVPGADF